MWRTFYILYRGTFYDILYRGGPRFLESPHFLTINIASQSDDFKISEQTLGAAPLVMPTRYLGNLSNVVTCAVASGGGGR